MSSEAGSQLYAFQLLKNLSLTILPGVQSTYWENYNHTLSIHQKRWKRKLNFSEYQLLIQMSNLSIFSK